MRGGWWVVVAVAVRFALLDVSASGAASSPPVNVHLREARTIALPGRGASLAWAPDGHTLAVGGRFRDPATRLRYDTRIADVASGRLTRSYACHYYWVIATAWARIPGLGEVIADGGGDHAVKLWNARGPGSTQCNPGQHLRADGGIAQLPRINGWITALAFSPDGRFLASTSRDGIVRIWQLEAGPQQWQVVSAWHEEGWGKLSLAWAPDGRHLVTGDRGGRVALWSFDPVADRWDDAMIAYFARMWFDMQPWWFRRNAAVLGRRPVWSEQRNGAVWTVRYAPDGSRVAAASAEGLVSVYDAASGAPLLRTGAPRMTPFHGLDWSPDGRLLAAGGDDHHLYLFEARTGARYDLLRGHADVITSVAWSPDGRMLASTAGGPRLSTSTLGDVQAGPDQTVRLWVFR
jgi:WD40 repeat protein